MRAITSLRLSLFLGCTLFAADGALARPTPIDLGTVGGPRTYPRGMNNRGDVVGDARDDRVRRSQAFLWTETNGMSDLGTLGGITGAVAVNDRGQVVGSSEVFVPLPGQPGFHVYLWTKQAGMVDLHAR